MARVRVRVRVTARVSTMSRNATLCYLLLRSAVYYGLGLLLGLALCRVMLLNVTYCYARQYTMAT